MRSARASRREPAGPADFAATFAALRAVLAPLGKTMTVAADSPGHYQLLAQPTSKCPDGLFFAELRTGKNYVSFHFMPIYGCADLRDGLSPELRARMQGKACFNFRAPPGPALRRELVALVREGRERFGRLKLP